MAEITIVAMRQTGSTTVSAKNSSRGGFAVDEPSTGDDGAEGGTKTLLGSRIKGPVIELMESKKSHCAQAQCLTPEVFEGFAALD